MTDKILTFNQLEVGTVANIKFHSGDIKKISITNIGECCGVKFVSYIDEHGVKDGFYQNDNHEYKT